MMKFLLKHYRCLLAAVACLVFSNGTFAQMMGENDAIMIPKNFLCSGVMYSNSNWKNYWEGTFKRENGNIGTLNTTMYTFMSTYGITNNLNVTLNAPYVTTHASAGTLEGQKGIQDISLTLKWRALRENLGSGQLSLYAIGTATAPLTNYQADFYPLALGTHSNGLSFRALVDYHVGKYFFTGSGSYMARSNTTIDRTSYYTTQLIYSNQVALPNMNDFNLRTGYRSKSFIVEVTFDQSTTLGGFDIRKNDMPFPSNRMNATTGGSNVRYTLTSLHGLELSAGYDYVFQGRNVGQANILHGGATYIFGFSKQK